MVLLVDDSEDNTLNQCHVPWLRCLRGCFKLSPIVWLIYFWGAILLQDLLFNIHNVFLGRGMGYRVHF